MWNQSGKKSTEEHNWSAFNSSKYEMEKCQTIQTLLTVKTDKDKHNFMLCKYFGINWNIPKHWPGYGMSDTEKLRSKGMSSHGSTYSYFPRSHLRD